MCVSATPKVVLLRRSDTAEATFLESPSNIGQSRERKKMTVLKRNSGSSSTKGLSYTIIEDINMINNSHIWKCIEKKGLIVQKSNE